MCMRLHVSEGERKKEKVKISSEAFFAMYVLTFCLFKMNLSPPKSLRLFYYFSVLFFFKG